MKLQTPVADPAPQQQSTYATSVNPEWVRLLDLLRMNVNYTRAFGSELHTGDGRTILDFLSGYCVHNTGHNHPHIAAQLISEIERQSPNMLQSDVSELAGQLARSLCERAGGKVSRAYFCSSGSEGIESVIKFARTHTGRPGIVYARGAFHGLTCGALSLMGDPFWRDGFGPLLPHTTEVPFNDLSALEAALKTRTIAAVVLEPIQSEAGIILPNPDYLPGVQALCRKHKTLFVLDEVQTGMGRTGRFLAAHHYGVEPDMVVLAKALSGGMVPSAAVLLTDEIHNSTYSSLQRAFIHTSTFSENTLAMRAGLAALEVLDLEGLADRADILGNYFRDRLRETLAPFDMVRAVRGMGMLTGIEFGAPSSLALRLSFEAFKAVHPGMFGQMLVMRMFQDRNILVQICGNNFRVLKAAPPLVVTEAQLDYFIDSIHDVVHAMHSSGTFWSDALQLVRRVGRL